MPSGASIRHDRGSRARRLEKERPLKGRLTITHLMIVTALFGAMARFLPGIMQREPQLPAIVHLPLIVVHLPLIFSQMIVLAFPALVLCLGAAKWLRSRHCAELSLVEIGRAHV